MRNKFKLKNEKLNSLMFVSENTYCQTNFKALVLFIRTKVLLI